MAARTLLPIHSEGVQAEYALIWAAIPSPRLLSFSFSTTTTTTPPRRQRHCIPSHLSLQLPMVQISEGGKVSVVVRGQDVPEYKLEEATQGNAKTYTCCECRRGRSIRIPCLTAVLNTLHPPSQSSRQWKARNSLSPLTASLPRQGRY